MGCLYWRFKAALKHCDAVVGWKTRSLVPCIPTGQPKLLIFDSLTGHGTKAVGKAILKVLPGSLTDTEQDMSAKKPFKSHLQKRYMARLSRSQSKL